MLTIFLLLICVLIAVAAASKVWQVVRFQRTTAAREQLADLLDVFDAACAQATEDERQFLSFLRSTAYSRGLVWRMAFSNLFDGGKKLKATQKAPGSNLYSHTRFDELMALHKQSVGHEAPLGMLLFNSFSAFRHRLDNNPAADDPAFTSGAFGAFKSGVLSA